MRLTSSMLADAAHVQGGKLYVLGGGYDTIRSRRFPSIHRSLTVVLVVEVEPHERERDLDLELRLIDEDGQDAGVKLTARLRVAERQSIPPGTPTVVPLATPLHNVRFAEPKGYSFVVSHDDVEIGRISFRVIRAASS